MRETRVRFALGVALAVGVALGVAGCGDDPTGPVTIVNRAPEITFARLQPATVRRSGTTRLRVEAHDEDGDTMTLQAQADHGVVVLDPGTGAGSGDVIWEGTYTHNGSSDVDTISITINDPRSASDSTSLEVTISGPQGS